MNVIVIDIYHVTSKIIMTGIFCRIFIGTDARIILTQVLPSTPIISLAMSSKLTCIAGRLRILTRFKMLIKVTPIMSRILNRLLSLGVL